MMEQSSTNKKNKERIFHTVYPPGGQPNFNDWAREIFGSSGITTKKEDTVPFFFNVKEFNKPKRGFIGKLLFKLFNSHGKD